MSVDEIATAYETVNLRRRGAGAIVELARPDSMNAWNRQLGEDLLDAIGTVAKDEDVRAVMLTGAGRGFSSGADLKDVSGGHDVTPEGHPDLRKVLVERYHPIILGIREMPKPVLAAVNGAAVGIGLSLALSADLVVARRSAYFLLAFVNIGLVPDGGSSAFVPDRVGFARATEMAMLGERIGAEQALEWGLINRVFDDEAFEDEAAALLDRLASGPTRSYAGSKRQLNAWMQARLAAQLELEADVQQQMAGSHDFAEGAMSFLQKRPPGFTGV